jgi:hypothetical protein
MARDDQGSDARRPGYTPAGGRPRRHDKQQVLDRIASQRERLSAHRAARARAALAAQAVEGATANDSFAARAVVFARQHPVAVAAAAGMVLMAGPGRVIKWATVLLPLVLRLTSLVRQAPRRAP